MAAGAGLIGLLSVAHHVRRYEHMSWERAEVSAYRAWRRAEPGVSLGEAVEVGTLDDHSFTLTPVRREGEP